MHGETDQEYYWLRQVNARKRTKNSALLEGHPGSSSNPSGIPKDLKDLKDLKNLKDLKYTPHKGLCSSKSEDLQI